MPRLPAADIQQREHFALSLFKANPGLSAFKANEQIQSKFGSKIRAKRVYELRSIAKNTSKSTSGPVSAGRNAIPRPKAAARLQATAPAAKVKLPAAMMQAPQRPGSMGLFIEGNEREVSFFTETIKKLNKVGLASLNVQNFGDGSALVQAG